VVTTPAGTAVEVELQVVYVLVLFLPRMEVIVTSEEPMLKEVL